MVRGAPLKVAVELDAVGRVKVNALHFAAQAFVPRQRLQLGGGDVFAGGHGLLVFLCGWHFNHFPGVRKMVVAGRTVQARLQGVNVLKQVVVDVLPERVEDEFHTLAAS